MKTYLIVDDDEDVETITISDDEQKRIKPKISYVETVTDVETDATSDYEWQDTQNKCGKQFLSGYHLSRHKKLVRCGKKRRRNMDRNNKCEICGKRFYQASNLRRHRKFVMCIPSDKDSGGGEKLCYVCGVICASQGALNAHLASHFSYRCFCGELFDSLKDFSIHRERHCPNNRRHLAAARYECYECGKNYIKKKDLILHLDREHQNTEIFICFQCNKVCATKKDLLKHLEMYSKQK